MKDGKGELSEVIKSLPDIFILYSLDSGPKTGYDIRKEIASLFGVEMSFGTLYPRLHRLQEQGAVDGTWLPRLRAKAAQKREYSLTEFGRSIYDRKVEALMKASLTLHMNNVLARREWIPVMLQEMEAVAGLRSILMSEGYSVQSHVRIVGESGVEHLVDMYASKQTGGGRETILLGLKVGDQEVGVNDVLEFAAQSFDLHADRAVLLGVPRLSYEARIVAEERRMLVFEAEDLPRAVDRLYSQKQFVFGKLAANL